MAANEIESIMGFTLEGIWRTKARISVPICIYCSERKFNRATNRVPPKVAACFSYYETLLTMGSVLNDYNIGKRIVDDAG